MGTLHVSYNMKGHSPNRAAINYWKGESVTWIQSECTELDSEGEFEAKRGTLGPTFCSHSVCRGRKVIENYGIGVFISDDTHLLTSQPCCSQCQRWPPHIPSRKKL